MVNGESDINYYFYKMKCAKKKFKYLIEDDRIDMEKVYHNIRYTLGI